MQKRAKKPAFLQNGHKSDTFLKYIRHMQPPSEPQINKNNPNEWFIFWNHDVPESLLENYPRRRIRIKEKDNINRYKGEAREIYAGERRLYWKYNLEKLNYNPFTQELT
jgi:hypothetical protein